MSSYTVGSLIEALRNRKLYSENNERGSWGIGFSVLQVEPMLLVHIPVMYKLYSEFWPLVQSSTDEDSGPRISQFILDYYGDEVWTLHLEPHDHEDCMDDRFHVLVPLNRTQVMSLLCKLVTGKVTIYGQHGQNIQVTL